MTTHAARWSCPSCDDVSRLLSQIELAAIMERFERHDLDKDDALSSSEFLQYRAESGGLRFPASHETADVEMGM